MGQPVVHFEVVGHDGDALKAFYSSLFGWEFEGTASPMNYGVVPRDGNTTDEGIGIGGGVGGVGVDSAEDGHVTFYVAVEDIDAALREAERLGGTRLRGPDEVPGMGIAIAHFGDPEGHLIGLVAALS